MSLIMHSNLDGKVIVIPQEHGDVCGVISGFVQDGEKNYLLIRRVESGVHVMSRIPVEEVFQFIVGE